MAQRTGSEWSVALLEDLRTMPVAESARHVLGCVLVAGACRARIVEVEAYGGESDPASHAWRGPTPRTQVMYGQPGRSYVYFTYGNHWMLNVVARPEGEAAAVLLRAAEPLEGLDVMASRRLRAKGGRDLLSGPGKLCQAFALDRSHNGLDLFDPASPLRLEEAQPPGQVVVGVRIGISVGRGELEPLRFIDADRVSWASKPLPTGISR